MLSVTGPVPPLDVTPLPALGTPRPSRSALPPSCSCRNNIQLDTTYYGRMEEDDYKETMTVLNLKYRRCSGGHLVGGETEAAGGASLPPPVLLPADVLVQSVRVVRHPAGPLFLQQVQEACSKQYGELRYRVQTAIQPSCKLQVPELSRSGKGGISSNTVASTSRLVSLLRARYSLARCCSSASAERRFESAWKISSTCALISGKRLTNLT